MKLNAIAIDDNQSALNIVENLSKKIDFLVLRKSFTNAMDAGNYLKNNENIHLIFLDINMPEMNGLEFLKTFKPEQLIIFISKHTEHAVDSYDIENEYDIRVVDFLPLPVQQGRFVRSCNKALELARESMTSLVLKDNKKKYRVKFDSIVLIDTDEIDSHFMNFYLTEKYDGKDKLLIRKTLSDLEKELPSGKFVRVSRSAIVNIDKIQMLDGDTIITPNKRLTLTDSYKAEFERKMGN